MRLKMCDVKSRCGWELLITSAFRSYKPPMKKMSTQMMKMTENGARWDMNSSPVGKLKYRSAKVSHKEMTKTAMSPISRGPDSLLRLMAILCDTILYTP